MFLYISALILVCMLMPFLLTTNCFSVFVLFLLTVAMSGIAGVLTATRAQEMVLLAAGTTTVVVFVMTVMACICVDFTPFTYIILVITMIVVVFGFFSIALLPYIPMIKLIYSVVAALLMCVYIIIDTQMIIGGKSHELDTHMYIFGSIMLYLDIVLLFFYILDILDS
ncbi:unnamed protein product [Lymnaea stagnalis]|uniref:Uncharacterized protein n=1 Tax=Lymnaea stagnalis TaxID=6523 RepID=A0AAV2HSR8_LYMST